MHCEPKKHETRINQSIYHPKLIIMIILLFTLITWASGWAIQFSSMWSMDWAKALASEAKRFIVASDNTWGQVLHLESNVDSTCCCGCGWLEGFMFMSSKEPKRQWCEKDRELETKRGGWPGYRDTGDKLPYTQCARARARASVSCFKRHMVKREGGKLANELVSLFDPYKIEIASLLIKCVRQRKKQAQKREKREKKRDRDK